MSFGLAKFVLVPLDYYEKLTTSNCKVDQPIVEQIENPSGQTEVQAKLLAIESRFRPRPSVGGHTVSSQSVQEETTADNQIIDNSLLASLSAGKVEKSRQIVDLIKRSERIGISKGVGILTIDGVETECNINSLLYDLQQPKKNLPRDAFPVLSILKLPDYLVTNTNAKEIASNEDKKRDGNFIEVYSSEPPSKRRWIVTNT